MSTIGTIHDVNDLLEQQADVTDVRDVTGIAKRAIAGLQALADRADVRVRRTPGKPRRIGSVAPGQHATHGVALVIEGETGEPRSMFNFRSGRNVKFLATLPVYHTVNGRPAFQNYEDGDVPFELSFTVSSASTGEETTFLLIHGTNTARRQLLAMGHKPITPSGEIAIPLDDEQAMNAQDIVFELPEPVATLVRRVVERLCQEVLFEYLYSLEQEK